MSCFAQWKVLALVLAVLAALGCRGHPSAPTPQPDPNAQVTPLERTGAVRITFLSANIAPGSTVTGCGSSIEGCVDRLRIRFRFDPPADGLVLYGRVYLHASNLLACLWSETGPFALQANVPTTLEIAIDRGESCRTPTTIATLAALIEGPDGVASRQTWSLHYVFAP